MFISFFVLFCFWMMCRKALLFFLVSANLVLLLLSFLPFVGCLSQENVQVGSSHTSIQQQKASKRALAIEIHGILLWASMGFLMPAGMLIIRISIMKKFHRSRFKILYYIHATFQVLAALLATIAAVISIRSFENSFKNCHQRVGLALYAAIYLQLLIGFRRPPRGTKWRSVWYFFHWLLGITTTFVGIFNTYLGLKAYHLRTSKSNSLWIILFTAQVSFMAFLYLFQDKWDYIKTQGVELCNEPNIIDTNGQGDSNNEEVKEPRRRSNSLGAYFMKSNALNKLFQLT